MSTMSSLPNGNTRCQRCGAISGLHERHCTNCGCYQGTPLVNSTQQYDHPPSIASCKQVAQERAGGLLTRYSTSNEQQIGYNHSLLFQELTPSQTESQRSFEMSAHFMQQAYVPNSSARLLQQNVDYRIGQSYGNVANEKTTRRRLSTIAQLLGVVVLLTVVVGGSFLGYTFFFANTSTQQSGSSATPIEKPIFHDAFTDNANGWSIQSYPGVFSIVLGKNALKLESDNNKLLWELVPGSKKYSDFQLSVDAMLSKGSQDNGYGIYVRGSLSQNIQITTFYCFELYGDGSFAIFRGVTDVSGITTTSRLVNYMYSSFIQKQGVFNHIVINAKGSTIRFTVNGQVLSTVSDTNYTSGSIALFVSNLQKAPPGATATFSHLAIYPAQG